MCLANFHDCVLFPFFIIFPIFSHPFSSFRNCLKGVCTFHHYHFLINFHHIVMFLLLFSYFIIFSSSLIMSSLFSTWFYYCVSVINIILSQFIMLLISSSWFWLCFCVFITFHHLTHHFSSFCHCFLMFCSSRLIIVLINFHHRAIVFV
jgi:hypothetical protein